VKKHKYKRYQEQITCNPESIVSSISQLFSNDVKGQFVGLKTR